MICQFMTVEAEVILQPLKADSGTSLMDSPIVWMSMVGIEVLISKMKKDLSLELGLSTVVVIYGKTGTTIDCRRPEFAAIIRLSQVESRL